MKTLKICLVILCLLPFRVVGTPQFSGANFFMPYIIVNHKSLGEHKVYYDQVDHDLIISHKWVLNKAKNTIYCVHRRMKKAYYLHRLIMNPGKKLVDHKDRNGLNNCRSNLRVCSISQNQWNKKIAANNKTGFMGVSFYKRDNRYRAQIGFKGKVVYIGKFDNAVEAATAYNQAASRLHGEFASLNEI